ncbi:hypothetical protein [Longimicrobium sp.]|uniref:hypothetical protein n=1 Tax=Longimicrobium sp. TaxID=2029185 RepID=UPI002E33C339|nr:hypothetical protein [Longimicrobium sp.]HEX6039759.1 hypothetical protein [Longimicrobium sp.]
MPIPTTVVNADKVLPSSTLLPAVQIPIMEDGPATYSLLSQRFGGWSSTGVFDAETALRGAAAFFNGRGGTLVIPPGTYTINRARIVAGPGYVSGPGGSDPGNIEWLNARGLRIVAHGARIDMFGAFHRTSQASNTPAGQASLSNELQICPFLFRDCAGLAIHGLEIDGNVDQMTRDASVVENQANSCLRLESCTDVLLDGVYAHHAPSDNFRFSNNGQYSPTRPEGDPYRGVKRACRRVTARGCRAEFAGRCNFAIIQVRGLTLLDCSDGYAGFLDAAYTTSPYGGHSPWCGIDIEPNDSATNDPLIVDVDTGEILIVRHRTTGNLGIQFADVISSSYHDGTTLLDCVIDVGATNPSTSGYGFAFQNKRGRVINGLIQLRGRSLDAGISTTGDAAKHASVDTRYEGVDIRGTSRMITGNQSQKIVFENCRIIGEHTAPVDHMIFNTNPRIEYRDCYIFVPAAAYDAGSGGQDVIYLYGRAVDTTFDTDFVDVATNYFNVRWTVGVSEDSRFPVGFNFRPAAGSTHDNALPYALNSTQSTTALVLGGRFLGIAAAAPTTGTWRRGDVLFNGSPSASGFVGWVCVTAGTPGTWKTFGPISA